MPLAVLLLLIAAGAAIVGQNILMTQISGGVSTVLIPLLMNSAVGLVCLTMLLVLRSGTAGLQEAVGAFRLWNILPGLLGSFFVFASIVGYQRLGAAATIAVLVTSQLIFGLLVDVVRSPGSGGYGLSVIGGATLVAGAVLIVLRNA